MNTEEQIAEEINIYNKWFPNGEYSQANILNAIKEALENKDKEIERLKGLLEKEFKNFRDTDSVERRWQQFKTDNNIEDAAIYTGNSLK